MKTSTKIVAWLFIVFAFAVTIKAENVGKPLATTQAGLLAWLFVIGPIALLRGKSWGWWLAISGPVVLAIGAAAVAFEQELDWATGLLGFFSVLAFLALFTDRPSRWAGVGTQRDDARP
jgi:hypothetical protein